MSQFRVLYLATTAGLGGYLCGSFANIWRNKFLQVSAQPKSQAETILWGDKCESGGHHEGGHHHSGGGHHPPGGGHHHSEGVGGGHHSSGGHHFLGGIGGDHHPRGSHHSLGAFGRPHHPPGTVGGEPAEGPRTLNWVPFAKGGPIFPHPEIPCRNKLEYQNFLLCYDNQTRTPSWTLEHITPDNIGQLCPTKIHMKDEHRVPKEFRSHKDDYEHEPVASYFKQLLLATAEFHKSNPDENYVYSNIAPLVKNHNVTRIMSELSAYIGYLAKHHHDVYVLSGALYVPELKNDGKWYMDYPLIGKSHVGVPTHYFKVILVENEDSHEGHGDVQTFRLECYKFENSPRAYHEDSCITDYLCRRRDLQREAGYLIFDEVKDHKICEKCTDPKYLKELSAFKERKRQQALKKEHGHFGPSSHHGPSSHPGPSCPPPPRPTCPPRPSCPPGPSCPIELSCPSGSSH